MYYELSLDSGDKSIAEIVNTKSKADPKKKVRQYIYLRKTNKKYSDRTLEITFKDKKTEVTPIMVRQPDECPLRVCCFGKSGSGKSYFAKMLAKDYNLVNPKNKVAFFSRFDNDSSITGKEIKNFCPIVVDENLIDDEMDLGGELHDKLCIFDDMELLKNPYLKLHMLRLQEECLGGGRHHNISTIVTKHKILDGKKNCVIKTECHQFVFFPRGCEKTQAMSFLDQYLKLPPKWVSRITNIPSSRWVLIDTGEPIFIVHQHGAFILDPEELMITDELKNRK